MTEELWSGPVPDDRERPDWEEPQPGRVIVSRHGGEELPEGYEVSYQMMPGDGPKTQEGFGPSQKFEALAYARGLRRGLTR